MKKVIKINPETGFYIEDVLLKEDEKTPSDCIEVICNEGFILPKWDGEKWVEGGSAPQPTSEQEIAMLKTELTATDYKIIKCSEYQLAGQELPYDVVDLHAERQVLRDKINTLEMGLASTQ